MRVLKVLKSRLLRPYKDIIISLHCTFHVLNPLICARQDGTMLSYLVLVLHPGLQTPRNYLQKHEILNVASLNSQYDSLQGILSPCQSFLISNQGSLSPNRAPRVLNRAPRVPSRSPPVPSMAFLVPGVTLQVNGMILVVPITTLIPPVPSMAL